MTDIRQSGYVKLPEEHREKKIPVRIHEKKFDVKEKEIKGLDGYIPERTEELSSFDFKREEFRKTPLPGVDVSGYLESRDEEDTDEPKCLSDHLASLVGKYKLHDVLFYVGPDRIAIPAHKMILSLRSKVFEIMLNRPTSDKNESKTKKVLEITVSDCEPDAFYVMLRALYAGIVEVDADSLQNVFYCARKYNVDILKQACMNYLRTGFTVENACQLYESDPFSDGIYALQFIEDHAEDVFRTVDFLKLRRESVKNLIQSPYLNIPELQLFIQLTEWGRYECRRSGKDPTPENIRETLGDLLDFVRFSLLKMDELTKVVSPTKLLTSSELLAIFTFLGTKMDDTKDKKTEKDGKGKEKKEKDINVIMEKHELWFTLEKRRRRSLFVDFKFDNQLKSRDIRILEGGKVVQTHDGSSGWQTVLSDKIFTEGVITWEITLDSYSTSNTWNVITGVVPADYSITQTADGRAFGTGGDRGWALITGTGLISMTENGFQFTDYTTRCAQGERIGHRLDLESGTLEFFRNGRSLGVAFRNVIPPVRMAIACAAQQTVSLNPHFKT